MLVVGEINPDIIVAAKDPAPEFGQVERFVDAVTLTIGSSSAIFACGVARLGLRTTMAGVVGDDPLGQFMLDALTARGIDVSGCQVDAVRPTGASVILAAAHDRAILTAKGTIGALDVETLPSHLLGRAQHVHLGAYFLQEASWNHLPAFFSRAQVQGSTTSFDCNWDPTGRWDSGLSALLPYTDVFLPNAAEAARLTGLDSVEDAARELAARASAGRTGPPRTGRPPTIAIKCGAGGAFAVSGTEHAWAAAIPARVVDTVGAGDSFDAGFVYAWLQGWPLGRSLAFAAACGSLSTEGAGGTDAQPTLEEALAALAARDIEPAAS